MLNATTDRRPSIAILPWDKGFRAWDPHDSASGSAWHPSGARIVNLTPDADDLAQVVTDMVVNQQVAAVLLVGRTSSSGKIHVQTRAENRIPGTLQRDTPLGAGIVRATLSTADVLRDLDQAGLAAHARSEAEDDEGSHLLFRILSQLSDHAATPPIGLMRLPRDMAPAQVNQAIRTVATSISRHLPALSPTA